MNEYFGSKPYCLQTNASGNLCILKVNCFVCITIFPRKVATAWICFTFCVFIILERKNILLVTKFDKYVESNNLRWSSFSLSYHRPTGKRTDGQNLCWTIHHRPTTRIIDRLPDTLVSNFTWKETWGLDSSKAAAVVWLLGAKVRSQPGPKGAIHGIGASPSGLLGIACKTCNSYNWVGDISA